MRMGIRLLVILIVSLALLSGCVDTKQADSNSDLREESDHPVHGEVGDDVRSHREISSWAFSGQNQIEIAQREPDFPTIRVLRQRLLHPPTAIEESHNSSERAASTILCRI